MAMPMLRFPDGTVCGWTGEWPPPEILLRATGKLSGGVVYVDPATMPMSVEELEEACEIERYKRGSYSKLPAEVDAFEHVARCAEYERVDG